MRSEPKASVRVHGLPDRYDFIFFPATKFALDWPWSTCTDVGTTYKLCCNDALRSLFPKLDNRVNLEFNPYFLDRAIENGLKVIECPITFHKRVGVSKGGNVSNMVALKLGFRMIRGILSDWQERKT